MITPSKQQLRHREVKWEGSWTAKRCTEVHEAHLRHVGVGEPAWEGKARHYQNHRGVHATAVAGKLLFLSGEICSGVTTCRDMHQRKTVCTWTEVSRGNSTGEGCAVRREGPNVNSFDWTRELVLRAATAAIPGIRVCRGGRR